MYARFEDWTQGRAVLSFGTNAGAEELPFQSWRHFKESFAPELIARALTHNKLDVKRCLDPFGGSGTTGIACQFFGVHPIIVEVNPFLADLIEAKLYTYDADGLAGDFGNVVRQSTSCKYAVEEVFGKLPATFVEPGVSGRWIFDRMVAARIAALLRAINTLSDDHHRRLFRVLLGGILVEVSNAVVNGKGRRYRRRWEHRRRNLRTVDDLFCRSAQRAIGEVHRFARRACLSYELHCGDSRAILSEHTLSCELAIFSPPYPNSFDYTDVYNIELWTLGYLTDSISNQALRRSTLCSHVQVGRDFPPAPNHSRKLSAVMSRLDDRRMDLWDHRIPDMIGGYFADIIGVLDRLRANLARNGSVWMIVGDSCYAEVQIETGSILAELAAASDWDVSTLEPCRSMRASAQQGGRPELAETLIVLTNR